MVLHFNQSRLYKGTVGCSHGVLVELMRHTRHFWKAYKELLEINGKRHSDEKELEKFMRKAGLHPEEKKYSEKQKIKIIARIHDEFETGLNELNSMFDNINEVLINDETLLFRMMMELVELYDKVWTMEHLPDHTRHSILHHLYSLMQHVDHEQHHTWISSKAHAREFTKVSEISLISSRLEHKRLRRQTIELNHLVYRIEPLQEWLVTLGEVRTQHIHDIHDKVVELLELYHKEIKDIHYILQEAHILTRRTEKMFQGIEHEAKELKDAELKKKVSDYAKVFHKIHKKFEDQARREANDIRGLLKDRRAPPRSYSRAA